MTASGLVERGVHYVNAAVQLAGAGSLTTVGKRKRRGILVLTGQGTVVLTPKRTRRTGWQGTGAAAFSAAAQRWRSAGAVLSGLGSLVVVGKTDAPPKGTLNAADALAMGEEPVLAVFAGDTKVWPS